MQMQKVKPFLRGISLGIFMWAYAVLTLAVSSSFVGANYHVELEWYASELNALGNSSVFGLRLGILILAIGIVTIIYVVKNEHSKRA